ncbi:MAG: DUF1573 domain-containing protein [bacterium]
MIVFARRVTRAAFATLIAGSCIAAADAARPRDAIAAPHIEFLETEYHLGKMEQHSAKSHTFLFTNTGDAPLTVTKTETTCGCTVAQATQGAIPPGGRGEVAVTFESREAFGEITKAVTVRSNADNAETKLSVTAFIRTDLYIHKFVQFGKVARDEASERTIEAKGDASVGFRVTKVETDAPYLSASFSETPSTAPEFGPKFEIRVALSPGAPPGTMNRKLLLHTNLSSKPVIEVPIYANVGGYLTFSTDALNFGTFAAGTAKVVTLDIAAPAEHPITIVGARSTSPDVTTSLETVSAGRAYRVICKVSAAKTPGRLAGSIVVSTNDRGEPSREVQFTGFAK